MARAQMRPSPGRDRVRAIKTYTCQVKESGGDIRKKVKCRQARKQARGRPATMCKTRDIKRRTKLKCRKKTHNMKVKRVVVGSMLMVRGGLVAPSADRVSDGAAGLSYKWHDTSASARASWDDRHKGSTQSRLRRERPQKTTWQSSFRMKDLLFGQWELRDGF